MMRKLRHPSSSGSFSVTTEATAGSRWRLSSGYIQHDECQTGGGQYLQCLQYLQYIQYLHIYLQTAVSVGRVGWVAESVQRSCACIGSPSPPDCRFLDSRDQSTHAAAGQESATLTLALHLLWIWLPNLLRWAVTIFCLHSCTLHCW